jgi:hypothetical protein
MNQSVLYYLIQWLPLLSLSAIYAVTVFLVARKRRVNPWPWTIATLIPMAGLFVAAIFYLVSLLSVLDRLNELESQATWS